MTLWNATFTTDDGRTHTKTVPASTIGQATRKALAMSSKALGSPAVALDVRPVNAPVFLDLVSNAEVAAMLGVSRQRAKQLDDNPPPGYPPAVARTSGGALRRRADVAEYARHRQSRSGA